MITLWDLLVCLLVAVAKFGFAFLWYGFGTPIMNQYVPKIRERLELQKQEAERTGKPVPKPGPPTPFQFIAGLATSYLFSLVVRVWVVNVFPSYPDRARSVIGVGGLVMFCLGQVQEHGQLWVWEKRHPVQILFEYGHQVVSVAIAAGLSYLLP